MDCVFVEELAGINAAKNVGILFNSFNLLDATAQSSPQKT
jgi:hypothetical protein